MYNGYLKIPAIQPKYLSPYRIYSILQYVYGFSNIILKEIEEFWKYFTW